MDTIDFVPSAIPFCSRTYRSTVHRCVQLLLPQHCFLFPSAEVQRTPTAASYVLSFRARRAQRLEFVTGSARSAPTDKTPRHTPDRAHRPIGPWGYCRPQPLATYQRSTLFCCLSVYLSRFGQPGRRAGSGATNGNGNNRFERNDAAKKEAERARDRIRQSADYKVYT